MHKVKSPIVRDTDNDFWSRKEHNRTHCSDCFAPSQLDRTRRPRLFWPYLLRSWHRPLTFWTQTWKRSVYIL